MSENNSNRKKEFPKLGPFPIYFTNSEQHFHFTNIYYFFIKCLVKKSCREFDLENNSPGTIRGLTNLN